MNNVEIFSDSARGVYIPQHFAECHVPALWTGIESEDIRILLKGPRMGAWYWDAWSSVLDNAKTLDGRILHQDGDLFVVVPDSMEAQELWGDPA